MAENRSEAEFHSDRCATSGWKSLAIGRGSCKNTLSQYGLRENPRPAMEVGNGSVLVFLDPVFGVLQWLLVNTISTIVLRGGRAVEVEDI